MTNVRVKDDRGHTIVAVMLMPPKLFASAPGMTLHHTPVQHLPELHQTSGEPPAIAALGVPLARCKRQCWP